MDLADEESDAAPIAENADRPDDAKWPAWAAPFWEAWQTLRFDRQYGAFGGQSPIFFSAKCDYADKFCIDGAYFDLFLRVIGIIDDEYLKIVIEQTPPPQKTPS